MNPDAKLNDIPITPEEAAERIRFYNGFIPNPKGRNRNAVDNSLKKAAIQDFCRAVRYQDQSIISMVYDPGKEAVQIRYTCGSFWVDVSGKNIYGMLSAVLKKVADGGAV
jgi:hypothetical protein